MSLQGPLVVVAESPAPDLIDALGEAGAFPVVESSLANAGSAIAAAKPSAIVLDAKAAADQELAGLLAQKITPAIPVVPVIACTADDVPSYREALTVSARAKPQTVAARIASALRVRSLHATVMRRADAAKADGRTLP